MRFFAFSFLALSCLAVAYQDPKSNPVGAEGYIRPPANIEEVVLAPWHKNSGVSRVSPQRDRYLSLISAGIPKLADVGRPSQNFGGFQIDLAAGRVRNASFQRVNGFEIRNLDGQPGVTILAPKGGSIASPSWSPDGSKVAYFVHFENNTAIFVADAKSGKSKSVTPRNVLFTLETQFEWLADSKRLVTVLVPAKRKPEPKTPAVATSPQVLVSDDKPSAIRTYAGLMKFPHEFDQLEWHSTGQLAIVNVENSKAQEVGTPTMIRNISSQADGSHFRVTLLERPFSYQVPFSSFPDREVLWDQTGKEVMEIAKRPLRFGTPPVAPPNELEKRSLSWRPDGNGMSFLQLSAPATRSERPNDPPLTLEQGGAGGRRPGGAGQTPSTGLRPGQKDRVMQWVAPYGEKDMKVVFESDQRIGSVQYSEDCQTLFITQTINGKSRTSAIRLSDPSKQFPIVEAVTGDNSFYEDPGSLLSREGNIAGSVVRVSSDNKFVYLSGTRYFKDPTKEAPRPFLEKVEIETGKKERIFESSPSSYETVSLLDDDAKFVLVSRQSQYSISQTYRVDLSSKSETQLTQNQDYAPDITRAREQTFLVTRNDGVKFQVKVTYPEGAKPGSKVPAFFWFYPNEYVDQAAYDRSKRTFNKNLFGNVSTQAKVILLRAGYALVENDCPIMGPDTRKNDLFVPQLRNNLSATINAICEDGTIDRNRLGIGGHSYGAFSTLNAMVHTPYFKAGIAGDGNYNRLLTPFGFQAEQRQLWESREVYLSMSPMLYLEQLTGAVLLYHGMADQNMGTDPINSPRLFDALEALGKPAALYMYPYEDHGQIAEETILDQWARFVAWLDKWVKGK